MGKRINSLIRGRCSIRGYETFYLFLLETLGSTPFKNLKKIQLALAVKVLFISLLLNVFFC
jgi:hypothetical protein